MLTISTLIQRIEQHADLAIAHVSTGLNIPAYREFKRFLDELERLSTGNEVANEAANEASLAAAKTKCDEARKLVATATDELHRITAERDALRSELDSISFELAKDGPQTIEHLLACSAISKQTTVIGRSRLSQLVTENDNRRKENDDLRRTLGAICDLYDLYKQPPQMLPLIQHAKEIIGR